MKKNKKSVFLVSSILGCTALVSVGFAAWVITGSPAEHEVTGGTIQVDTVDNNVVSFVTASSGWVGADDQLDPNSNKIVFGGKVTTGGEWLVNETLENRTVTYRFVIENYEALDSVTATITASDSEKYQDAVDAKYIAALPTFEPIEKGEGFVTVAGQPTQMSYDLEITFNWGEEFGFKNPMEYYNDGTKTAATHGAEAERKLTELYTLLSGVTYTLTLTATASTGA